MGKASLGLPTLPNPIGDKMPKGIPKKKVIVTKPKEELEIESSGSKIQAEKCSFCDHAKDIHYGGEKSWCNLCPCGAYSCAYGSDKK